MDTPSEQQPSPAREPTTLRTTCPCGAVHEAPRTEGLIYHQTVQFFLQAHGRCIERYWLNKKAPS